MKKKILQAVNNYGNYSIGGVSFVYNQLVQNGNFADTQFWGGYARNFSVDNNIAKIKMTAAGGYLAQSSTAIVGHKYFIKCDIKTPVDYAVMLRTVGFSINNISKAGTGDFQEFAFINTASSSSVEYRIRDDHSSVLEDIQAKNFISVDLTDLETALGITINTIEDFYSTDFGKQVKNGFIPPYAPTNTIYNATSPFRFSGDNLFDNSKALLRKRISDDVGSIVDYNRATCWVSDFIKVKPNTNYTFFGGSYIFYDTNKNYISGSGGKSVALQRNITTPNNCYFLRIDASTQGVDINTEMLTEGSTPKPYVKYIDRTFAPETPITLRSAQNIRDTWRNCSGKKNDLVGSVDLGDLNWQQIGDYWSTADLRNIIKGGTTNVYSTSYTDIVVTGGGSVRITTTNSPTGQLNYELATPTTELAQSMALPKGITKVRDANGVELPFDIHNLSITYNQLIPNANITKTITTSSVPSQNEIDPYILVKAPNLVGHRVYAKIITSNPKLRVGWYKTFNTGYDFATGTAITATSALPTANEGVYEITQDMVHSGTNYLQLYFFKGNGLEVGTHTITIQLVDLTQLGMQNIINVPIFKATELGKLIDRNTVLDFTGETNATYRR